MLGKFGKLRDASSPRAADTSAYFNCCCCCHQVLLHIPAAMCLVVDYASGLRLPSEGSWPNLVEGLNRCGASPEPFVAEQMLPAWANGI